MRSPTRIPRFMSSVGNLWMSYYPDWRFGQLMENIVSAYYNKYGRDIFYVEDEEMLKFITEEFFNQNPHS